MDQAAHAIGKEHVYLLRFHNRRHFAEAKVRVQDRLARSIGTRLFVGRPDSGVGSATGEFGSTLEGAKFAALRAIDTRNQTALGY
jgi:hypothetical protein